MSESYSPALREQGLLQFLTSTAGDAPSQRWESAPVKISTTRSIGACMFLMLWTALYLGATLAGAALVERVWVMLLQ